MFFYFMIRFLKILFTKANAWTTLFFSSGDKCEGSLLMSMVI